MGKKAKTLDEKLIESGIIVICGLIDSEKASKIIFKLLSLSTQDETTPIQLFISSRSGSYLDILAIYDTINTLKNPISATCVGEVGGYATLLLAACNKGSRYALKHSRINIDQPFGILQSGVNQQTEIEIEATEAALKREVFEKILAEKTGQNIAKIHKDCEVGIELKAQEAVEYGLIDKIIE